MSRLQNVMFRRAGTVQISAAGGIFTRHGVIRPASRAVRAAEEIAVYGTLEAPLYIYTGDAEELLLYPDAAMYCGTEKYRVLEARAVEGFRGRVCVRAVLERQVGA